MPGPASCPKTLAAAPDGSAVLRVGIANGGARAWLITWGGSLQDFRAAGARNSLVLGSDDFAAYLGPMRHFGAIVGRVANRIARGRAMLDGTVLTLDRNEGGRTTLHGGAAGSSVCNWRLEGYDATSCRMSLRLPHGQGGFPGTLDIVATYSVDAAGALDLQLEGRTDRPTFCNLASHGYWTLDGAADLGGHRLQIAADRYIPVDAEKIPLGAPAPVAGTPFDFRASRSVSGGLDHCFCLGDSARGMRSACTLGAADLELALSTTAPGLQVYDGAHLSSAPFPGHHGAPYGARAGVALEPQHWPDAPNNPAFPSVLLRPGETYCQRSRFHVRRTQAQSPEETT